MDKVKNSHSLKKPPPFKIAGNMEREPYLHDHSNEM